MASPCVVLVDTEDHEMGAQIGRLVMAETQRIEAKYSRYRPSVLTSINEKANECLEVDSETADLIDYAASCYELSDGSFDITSGALRRIWRFDGSGAVPTPEQVTALLAVIGWHRASWDRPQLRLASGMEIDFGGIGKEYAVDRAMLLVQSQVRTPAPCLINLGGDLRVSGPRRDGSGWRVAIEDAERTGATAGLMELTQGAVATSGDTYRYVIIDGVRYGHVLDPRTGRPVPDAPRSVTVHASTCSEAGLLAKLALLAGSAAEDFLRRERTRAWCYR
jgi:thiamine biosynthesis lipoprotein